MITAKITGISSNTCTNTSEIIWKAIKHAHWGIWTNSLSGRRAPPWPAQWAGLWALQTKHALSRVNDSTLLWWSAAIADLLYMMWRSLHRPCISQPSLRLMILRTAQKWNAEPEGHLPPLKQTLSSHKSLAIHWTGKFFECTFIFNGQKCSTF